MRVSCLLISILLAFCACKGPDDFRLTGEVEGGGSTALTLRYYGNDAVNTDIATTNGGRFECKLSSSDLTLIRIFDKNRRTIGLLCGQNGDELSIQINPTNPCLNRISGTPLNLQLSEALNANADSLNSSDPQVVNRAVERYISANPDDVISTIMYVAFYDAKLDPLRADSVLNLINPEVQWASLLNAYAMQLSPFALPQAYSKVGTIKYRATASDSTLVFDPAAQKATLLVISDQDSWRRDSVLPHLRRIHKAHAKHDFRLVDLSVWPDTNAWKGAIMRDSAQWLQVWAPGGTLADGLYELAIPKLPFYIVTDTTGSQIYRGRSPYEAEAAIDGLLK